MSNATLTFTFPAAAAPFGATVFNALGQVVGRIDLTVTDTTCAGSISLPVAPNNTYHARSEGFDGDAAGLVADDASIAAGGGGAVIDAASVLFEINNGVTIAPDGSQGNLTWDTVPEGYTGSASALALDTGVYHVSLDLEFSTPAEDRLISVFFNSENSIVSGVGPLTIASVGNNAGRLVQANGLAIIRAGGSISVSTATSSQGASSPADLAVGYAALTLTPFIPA